MIRKEIVRTMRLENIPCLGIKYFFKPIVLMYTSEGLVKAILNMSLKIKTEMFEAVICNHMKNLSTETYRILWTLFPNQVLQKTRLCHSSDTSIFQIVLWRHVYYIVYLGKSQTSGMVILISVLGKSTSVLNINGNDQNRA